MPVTQDAFGDIEGVVWVQPDGPNTPAYPLLCHDLDGMDESAGPITTRLCLDSDGTWRTIARWQGTPESSTFEIATYLPKTQAYMHQAWMARCPHTYYIHKGGCAPFNVFGNYQMGILAWDALIESRSSSGMVRRRGEEGADVAPSELTYTINVAPLAPWYWPMSVSIITIAEDQDLRDVVFCNVPRCAGPCGSASGVCDNGWVVGNAVTGSAAGVADAYETDDNAASWTAAAANPFGTSEDIASVICCQMGPTTTRVIVARGTTDAGNPAEIAYTDDDGATWTSVNVGTVNGDYFLHGGALFCLNHDYRYIWAVTSNGTIYKSTDGGASWTQQYDGTSGFYAVNFVDANYGFAVGAANAIVRTEDGGSHWTAVTGPAAQAAVIATGVSVVTENRTFVTYADGELWFTEDRGATWDERQLPAPGALGLGDVMFIDEYAGVICGYFTEAAHDYGVVFRTVNGGYDWEAYRAPDYFDARTSYGLKAIWMCSINEFHAVGEAVDSVALIMVGRVAGA